MLMHIKTGPRIQRMQSELDNNFQMGHKLGSYFAEGWVGVSSLEQTPGRIERCRAGFFERLVMGRRNLMGW